MPITALDSTTTALTASSITASSAAAANTDGSAASFASLLEQETTAVQERPCMAQFMVMTGCDESTASRALYQYENWRDYLSDDATLPDVSTAQLQLQAEVSSGTRVWTGSNYGQRDDFAAPAPYVPDVPGKVVPVFDESTGKATGLGFVSAEGTPLTTAGMTDKETILQHTDGFHIGRAALDTLATQITGDENATFDALDLSDAQATFPDMETWLNKFGITSTYNGYTPTAATSTDTDGTPLTLATGSGLYASAALNSYLFANLP